MTTFYCEGTVRVDDTLTSGIEVRLYTRDNGELVSSTATTASGTFSVVEKGKAGTPVPGFEAVFAIVGLLSVVYLLRRRR